MGQTDFDTRSPIGHCHHWEPLLLPGTDWSMAVTNSCMSRHFSKRCNRTLGDVLWSNLFRNSCMSLHCGPIDLRNNYLTSTWNVYIVPWIQTINQASLRFCQHWRANSQLNRLLLTAAGGLHVTAMMLTDSQGRKFFERVSTTKPFSTGHWWQTHANLRAQWQTKTPQSYHATRHCWDTTNLAATILSSFYEA